MVYNHIHHYFFLILLTSISISSLALPADLAEEIEFKRAKTPTNVPINETVNSSIPLSIIENRSIPFIESNAELIPRIAIVVIIESINDIF